MANEKDKTKGAAAARAPAEPAKKDETPAAPAQPEAAKRTRLSFSAAEKLAFVVNGLVGILNTKEVAAVLTEDQKAKAVKAKAEADKVGVSDPFKAVNDRITAIQGELKAVDYSKDPTRASAQVIELGKELDRQIKRKAQIQEMIGG